MVAAVKLELALFMLTVVAGGKLAGSQVVHHVVSGDLASDISPKEVPWSSGGIFRVGDTLLFRYFTPQETIVELGSMEEYYSCNLTNPIKMYTEPVNQVPLEKEGIRYFASGSYENCKNGLKLPVQVKPPHVPPVGPTPIPSSSTPLYGLPALTFTGLLFMGFVLI